jgi:hypothetical protein
MTIKTGEKMYASDILNLTFFPKGAILTFSSAAWSATSAEFKNIWKVCNAANHAADPTIPDLTNVFLRGAESSGATGGADSQSVTAAQLPAHNHAAGELSLGRLSADGLKATGGSHDHTLSGRTTEKGNHGHGFSDPGHSHPVSTSGRHGSVNKASNPTAAWDYGDVFWSAQSTVTSGHKSTGITFRGDGAHDHSLSSDSKAASTSHEHTVTGSVSGGSISGSTANAGSNSALVINTVPAYYTVIYIIKVV